jgi:hypothetical protein
MCEKGRGGTRGFASFENAKEDFLMLPLLSISFSFLPGVAPPTFAAGTRMTTSLSIWIPEEDMTANQLEIKRISDKWSEVRLMSSEDAASLEPEWKEAYDRYYEKYHKDMKYMMEITNKVQALIEPPKVQKKTKGQKKRDKWAIVQAREAARAAAAAAEAARASK